MPGGVISSVPKKETTNAGPYLQFDGERFYSSGRAVSNVADRFTRAGDINGHIVYREVKGNPKTIYVESVPGGPLAPYSRR